ncbi:uncharacterized protein LOC111627997 [Centruroides sculpturatus]|uniref:uncharacterized protein LOC111627997 n=1 Tax=Centruroides sculpturatus TaxID=218467 RepID=UPI000C6EFA0A|nr:uncharacterized protein LOC111627997 [Centruroides sculpturatus]
MAGIEPNPGLSPVLLEKIPRGRIIVWGIFAIGGGIYLEALKPSKISESLKVESYSGYSLKSVYELIENNFSQLSHDIQGIKNEVQHMKEENKSYQEEMQNLTQEMKKPDALVKHNGHLKGKP